MDRKKSSRSRRSRKSRSRSNSREKSKSRRSRRDSREKSRSRKDSDERKSRDSKNSRKNSRKNSEKSEEEVPIEDVRKHILQHYGISAEEEKMRKERKGKPKAEKFRNYVQNSGLQLAFQLVISEMITQNVPKDKVFKYATKRFREIGKEYSDIKKSVQDGEDRKAKSKGKKKKRR